MSTTPTDAELIKASISGKISAFGELIERYQNLVCAVAYSTTGDRALSEDVGQETFVVAWKQLADIREPAKFKGWLCSTARNLSKMALRKRKREVLDGDDAAEGAEASDASALEVVLSNEQEDLVWSALKEIPETYREPLVLFYREEQSVKQVALGLGISEDAVKQRLSRGRQSLKQGLEKMVERTLADTRPSKAFAVGVLALIAAQAGTAAAASSAGGSGGAVTSSSVGAKLLMLVLLVAAAIGVTTAVWMVSESDEPSAQEAKVSSDVTAAPSTASRSHWRAKGGGPPAASDTKVLSREELDDLLDPKNPEVIVEVLDLLGGPIAGAEVLVNRELVGETNGQGVLRVPTAAAQISGARSFQVRAHGYAEGYKSFSGYGRLTVQLVPESTISGIVISAEDGTPIKGLRVLGGRLEPVMTDEAGRFVFDRVSPGRYDLTAVGPGWNGKLTNPLNVGLHVNETNVVIEVAHGFAITGRVVSTGEKLPSGLFIAGGPIKTPVDEAGHFKIEGVGPGSYQLAPKIPSKLSLIAPIRVEVVAADVTGVEIPLEMIHSIDIIATQQDGTPVAGMPFYGLQLHGGGGSACKCTTGDDGRCRIEGLAPATIRGFGPNIAGYLTREITVPSDQPVRFEVPAVGGISGVVLTPAGDPLPWRKIMVQGGDLEEPGEVISDAKGRFLFGGLVEGSYEVKVYGHSSAYALSRDKKKAIGLASVSVGPGELVTGVRVQADHAKGQITGRVVGVDGQPQPSALVTFLIDRAGLPRGIFRPGVEMAVADSEGRFSFNKVDSAYKYQVFAQSVTGEQGTLRGISADGTPLSIAVTTPAELRVTLTSASESREDVNVTVKNEDGDESTIGLRLNSKMNGGKGDVASFPGIEPGTWRVTVTQRKEPAKVTATATVTIQPGQVEGISIPMQ